MTRLLGYNALVVALGAALFGAMALFVGARRNRSDLVRNGRTAVYAVLSLATLMLCCSVSLASPSNKWRLQFSGSARSEGVITLQFTPKGGLPFRTETSIAKGTGENAVAKAVVESLRAQLPKDGYHVERDDGEDVLVKKRRGVSDFDIEVLSNTVENVRIRPDRE